MALQEEFEKEGNLLFRYRSYLPLVLLAAGLLVGIFAARSAPARSAGYVGVCLAVSLVGVAVRVVTVGHTPAGTSGRNTAGQVAESLNTTGIYSLVRHPLYVGNFFMYLGLSMLAGSAWFVLVFVTVYWLYYERIMFAEEQFLRRKFGREFTDWAAATPAFVPSLKHYRRAAYAFSWKKVLKKEKNGVFALFLIFCLFDAAGRYVGGQRGINTPLAMAAAVTGAAYVVLKYLKRHTCVLDEAGR